MGAAIKDTTAANILVSSLPTCCNASYTTSSLYRRHEPVIGRACLWIFRPLRSCTGRGRIRFLEELCAITRSFSRRFQPRRHGSSVYSRRVGIRFTSSSRTRPLIMSYTLFCLTYLDMVFLVQVLILIDMIRIFRSIPFLYIVRLLGHALFLG